MPTPTPEPTAAEIVSLMEIMGENDDVLVAGLIEVGTQAIVDAKWAKTLADITEWNTKVRGKYAKVDGRVKLDPNDRAFAIRSRARTRYGLTELIDQSVRGGAVSLPGSVVVNTSLRSW
jgi:hypothetical protein